VLLSGKSAASSRGFSKIRKEVVAAVGDFVLREFEVVVIERIRTGCLRSSDLLGEVKEFNPMSPCMVAVFMSVFRPPGFAEGRWPCNPDVNFIRVMVFRCSVIMCSRGLRGCDPLLPLEKFNSVLEMQGSPRFSDLVIENDKLQVKLVFPDSVTFTQASPVEGWSFGKVWRRVLFHPDSYITVNLRWLKNNKEADFVDQIGFTRCIVRDMCLVFNLFSLLDHRLRFFNEFNWDFIFTVPKPSPCRMAVEGYGMVERGDLVFLPFTRARFSETWLKIQKSILGSLLYNIHDLRRGLQKAAKIANAKGDVLVPFEMRREFGFWKKPKDGMPELYAGRAVFFLDELYRKLLVWDLRRLFEGLSGVTSSKMVALFKMVRVYVIFLGVNFSGFKKRSRRSRRVESESG
jgi:hypothetical protein